MVHPNGGNQFLHPPADVVPAPRAMPIPPGSPPGLTSRWEAAWVYKLEGMRVGEIRAASVSGTGVHASIVLPACVRSLPPAGLASFNAPAGCSALNLAETTALSPGEAYVHFRVDPNARPGKRSLILHLRDSQGNAVRQPRRVGLHVAHHGPATLTSAAYIAGRRIFTTRVRDVISLNPNAGLSINTRTPIDVTDCLADSRSSASLTARRLRPP